MFLMICLGIMAGEYIKTVPNKPKMAFFSIWHRICLKRKSENDV